ncbi:MAG: Na+/H+ antiporter NhaC [Planctomycetes bacterium]|nr:Na+/H+ antiporter NhaC [Planctomycetota bacterium]
MPQSPPAARAERAPSLLLSLLPVAGLVGLLVLNVRVFASADNQISLVLATALAAFIAVVVLRQPWQRIEEGMVKAIGLALQAILILLVVGMLIAAWIQSGVVPLLIVYGLELVSPPVFLVTACLVCCVVSLACGSSWTTAGTVGVALMGIGQTLGIDAGMVAGAVVSGSYFGDKMSPLSDTTNLAPAMAGATLFDHVRHMIWTVTPALLVSLALYAVLGGRHDASPASLARVTAVVETLRANFVLTPWLLLPPLLVLGLVVRKFPALPALVLGTFGAVALGLVVQPQSTGALTGLGSYFSALYGGYALDFHAPAVAGLDAGALESAKQTVTELLDGRGGMKGMLGTVALIVCALSFGGVMERSGMLGCIAQSILKLVRGTGSLIAATILTCFGINVLASDQYMAIVVPGRMFKRAFLDRRLHPKNLSRALEDSGTVTSALVPWNTCGAQMTAVLGVATVAYAPYAFLNWLCPIVSIVYGFTGISITKISDAEAARYSEVDA